MNGLDQTNCSYADICKHHNCAECKLTKEDSDFHATHILGYSMNDILKKQQGEQQ